MLKKYHVIVAGGCITSLFTNKEVNDVDMYFKSKKDLSDFLYEEMQGSWVIAHTDKALLFKYDNKKIQAIYFKFYETAEQIFDTFDFTVCMGAYDFDKEEFVLHNDFLRHNASKILKFNANTAFPIVSALRVSKYVGKGYYISKAEYLRIMLTIVNSNIPTYEILKAQIGGMYGENYDNLLEPKDSEEFDVAKIVEKMKGLNLDKNYFVLPQDNEINDWDEFVYGVLQEKIKYFRYKEKNYRVIHGEVESMPDAPDDKYEQVDIHNLIKFPLVRYKYVKRYPDDTLHSFYDRSYVWKIGENVSKGLRGLFAVKSSEVGTCSYSNENDRVLLELLVISIEDVRDIQDMLDNTCDFNKVIVTRVVPVEEIKQMIENSKNSDEELPWAN